MATDMKLMSLKSADLIEPDTEKFKPCFVTKPEPEEVNEGQCARFVCRVTGYPKPRVMWLLNGHTVINVSLHMSFTMWRNFENLRIYNGNR